MESVLEQVNGEGRDFRLKDNHVSFWLQVGDVFLWVRRGQNHKAVEIDAYDDPDAPDDRLPKASATLQV